MRNLAIAVLLGFTVLVSAAEQQKRIVKPDEVQFTKDPDDIEFCAALGEVKAKSGWGNMGEDSIRATLRKRSAALGGNVLFLKNITLDFIAYGSGDAYACSAENLEQQRAKLAEIVKKATEPIVCGAGTDCELKWARATQWLQDHSKWKFRNVTDTLITTEGPMDTPDPAFEVTKMPTGDGKTYRVVLRPFCNPPGCEKTSYKLRASFHDFLLQPIPTQ